MTVAISALITIFAIYCLIWVYLITGYLRTQRQAVQAFLTAWEQNTYTVDAANAWETNEVRLRIRFKDNNSERIFDTDEDGTIISDIKWADEGRKVVTPSAYSRRKLEEITKQIATMAKLEGKLELDDAAEGNSI